MMKNKSLSVGLFGMAPKDLEEYLIEMKKKQQADIRDISLRLERLEKASAAHDGEILELRGLLCKPDPQQPFIELAERFLARFERIAGGMTRTPGAYIEKAAFDRKEEERRRVEVDLRVDIARCSRQINALLREMKRQEGLYYSGRNLSPEEQRAQEEETVIRKSAKPEAGAAVGAGAGKACARDDSLRFRYLMGKAVGKDLVYKEGDLLIRKGEPISLETAEEVERRGLMEELVKNLA